MSNFKSGLYLCRHVTERNCRTSANNGSAAVANNNTVDIMLATTTQRREVIE